MGAKPRCSSLTLGQSIQSVVFDSLRPQEPQHASLPVHHQLPESTQTHVHQVGDAIQPSHPLSSPSPPALIFPSARGGHNPEEPVPHPPFQMLGYRRLSTPSLPDVGFLGRAACRRGGFRRVRGALVGAPARGSPSQQFSAGSTSPLGGPRAEQMAGEASGRVSCCYLSLMTRSVNSVGNTPSCLCMPPALITVIEL